MRIIKKDKEKQLAVKIYMYGKVLNVKYIKKRKMGMQIIIGNENIREIVKYDGCCDA